jgi:hypothetical protein
MASKARQLWPHLNHNVVSEQSDGGSQDGAEVDGPKVGQVLDGAEAEADGAHAEHVHHLQDQGGESKAEGRPKKVFLSPIKSKSVAS